MGSPAQQLKRTPAMAAQGFSATVTGFVSVVGLMALLGIASLPHTGMERPGTLVLLALLAAAAGLRTVKLESLGARVTASDPFILATLALLGPLPAVIVSLAAVLGSNLTRAKRPRLLHHVFNLAALCLATAAAGHLYLALDAGGPLPLFAAAVVHFAVNTVLASTVIALHRQRSFFAVLRSCYEWAFVSMMTAAVLATGMILLADASGSGSLALALPSILPLAAYHQLHRERMER